MMTVGGMFAGGHRFTGRMRYFTLTAVLTVPIILLGMILPTGSVSAAMPNSAFTSLPLGSCSFKRKRNAARVQRLSYARPWSPQLLTPYTFLPARNSKDEHDKVNKEENDDEMLFAGLPQREQPQQNKQNDDWRAFRARLVMQEQHHGEEADRRNEFSKSLTALRQDEEEVKPTSPLTGSVSSSSDHASSSDSSSWAYEAGVGGVIEAGTVILNHPPNPEQDFGYGLGRQYLHKSVVLILDHDPHYSEDVLNGNKADDGGVVTRGVILNRPTDLILADDTDEYDNGEQDTSSFSCRIWYGGNEHSIHTTQPKFFCLHSLVDCQEALDSSREVIRGIHFTPLQNAKELVRSGHAVPCDFWTFAGFASWQPGELEEEVAMGYWHAVSTDSKTLRDALRILTAGGGGNVARRPRVGQVDPREAGLRTWSVLMDRIGRCNDDVGCTVSYDDDIEIEDGQNDGGTFDDLMLTEWASEYLVFNGERPPLFLQKNGKESNVENVGNRDNDPYGVLPVGTIVRATVSSSSSSRKTHDRSPFLLHDQEYHKSLVLILQDDADFTLGVLLNRPSSKTIDLEVTMDDSDFGVEDSDRKRGEQQRLGAKKKISLPLLYGGPMEMRGAEEDGDGDGSNPPGLWVFHMSSTLREAGIGDPIGDDDYEKNAVWECNLVEAAEAVGKRMASPEEFLVVKGFNVWRKDLDGQGGLTGGILEGQFETVGVVDQGEQSNSITRRRSRRLRSQVWDLVTQHKYTLSADTIDRVIHLSNVAWSVAGGVPLHEVLSESMKRDSNNEDGRLRLQRRMEQTEPEDAKSSFVFHSKVKVSVLGDDALRTWMAAYLLDDPKLRP